MKTLEIKACFFYVHELTFTVCRLLERHAYNTTCMYAEVCDISMHNIMSILCTL